MTGILAGLHFAYVARADLADGLIAHWPFQGSAADATTNRHDGDVNGQTLIQDHFGIANGAYHFDGNSYISVPDSDAFTLGSSAFTIAAWARLDAYGPDGGYYFMGHSDGPGTTAKWIFWLGNSGIQFVAAPVYWLDLGSYNFQLDRWYHVAVRRAGNQLTAFVNGTPIGTNSITAAIPDPSAPLFIGSGECCDRPNRPFRGTIDDVRIYKRALSDEEMRTLQDVALLMANSSVVRTQNTACLSLVGAAPSSAPSAVNFTLQAPAGHLSNVVPNTTGCWTGTVTPQPNAQWLVVLKSSCTNTPMDVQTIGSLCFTAVSEHSGYVPLTINDIVVTNLDGSLPLAFASGSRAVVIANEPLLEAWRETSGQRMLKIYGKANTSYLISYKTTLATASSWAPVLTNLVPASMSYAQGLTGVLSSAPVVFLRAKEN